MYMYVLVYTTGMYIILYLYVHRSLESGARHRRTRRTPSTAAKGSPSSNTKVFPTGMPPDASLLRRFG